MREGVPLHHHSLPAVRDAVLPLWADHIGLSAATASLVFGIGALADLLCSYPAGMVMDRYGRRAMAVPSLLVIGASLFALPFSPWPTR